MSPREASDDPRKPSDKPSDKSSARPSEWAWAKASASTIARWPWLRKSMWKQLLLPIVGLWAAFALLAASAAYLLAGQSTASSFDRLLGDDAYALAAQLRWDGGQANFNASKEVADALVFDSLSMNHYLVRTESGRRLAGDRALQLPAAADPARTVPQYFDHAGGSHGMHRIAALRMQPSAQDEAVWVLVDESKVRRQQVKDEIALAIFVPAAITGLIVIPLFYFGIRRGLLPARRLSALVAEHSEDNLSPLNEKDVPEELREVVAHTNSLLQRLQLSVDEQRRFIADAAHQLQTPVAGIRLLVGDMRRIQRVDPTQPMDGEVLRHLDDVATRAARMVKQLLAYARIAEDAVVEDEHFNATEVVLDAAERWNKAVLAASKQLAITATNDGMTPFAMRGSPTLLGEVVSNLIDNAVRYGGKHIFVDINLSDPTVLVLRVGDDGPPLDAKTRDHMLLPFWRGEHGQPEGSGLGLSIVQRIVGRAGGTFRLLPQSASGGVFFEIVLHRADNPAS